jgi:hypothetical protein
VPVERPHTDYLGLLLKLEDQIQGAIHYGLSEVESRDRVHRVLVYVGNAERLDRFNVVKRVVDEMVANEKYKRVGWV